MNTFKAIERLQEEKGKEVMKFSRTYMKVLKGFSGFYIFASLFLKNPDYITFRHCLVMFLIVLATEKCECLKRFVMPISCMLFLGLDVLCVQAAYIRFPQYSGLFIGIATQIFIQSHLEYSITEFHGYLLIILHTLLWVVSSYIYGTLDFSAMYEIYSTILFGTVLKFFWLKFNFERYRQRIGYKVAVEINEKNISALLQGIPEGILVLDENFIIKMHNSSYAAMLKNCSLSEAKYFKKRHNPEYSHNDNLKDDISQFCKSKSVTEIFGILCVNDVKIECTATKILWNNDNAIVLTFREVSRLIDMEKQIRKKSAELRSLRDVSHELKTPLNIIIHEQSEILYSDCIISDSTRVQLQRSLSMSHVLLNSIKDILDYSQIQSANFKLCPSLLNLNSFIEECLTIIKFTYGDNPKTHDFSDKSNQPLSGTLKSLKVNICPRIPSHIFTDKSRLRQVLISLLTSNFGYQVISKTLSLKGKGHNIRFAVKVFHEITSNTSSNFDSGVRFKIASSIVNQLTNQPLKVSYKPCATYIKFYILTDEILETDELEIPDEGSILWPLSPVGSSTNSQTELIDILIVDDMKLNLDILKRILENLNKNCKCEARHKKYVVHTANSGFAALEMLRKMNEIKSGYRLIIMDCQMPEMDGWEASLAIRKMFDNKEICHLPYIIAYSAFDSYEDIEKCLRSGMISHLSKPCQHEELCEVISVWMSKPLQKL